MDQYITGSTIRKLREGLHMTQSQLAEAISVTDKAISRWETGRGYPDITLLEPLAGALRVSVTELLSGGSIVNRNTAGNMLRSPLYICPICGNVIHSVGQASISCCGVTLIPAEAEDSDEGHEITLERVEDETYITVRHEMTKTHYITFLAWASGDSFQLIKLYPEGDAAARMKLRGHGILYWYCNRHGLYRRRV